MTANRDPGTEDGWLVIDAGARAASELLGEALASSYAIGSLAHGGFSAAVSDVDLALLTSGIGDEEVPIDRVAAAVRRDVPGALAERLSIFHVDWARFADPPATARFPPIDRLDLMRSGVLVHGEDLRDRFGVEPPREEVLDNAVRAALVRNTPAELRVQIDGLDPAGLDVLPASKLVLWPVRLLHTIDTASAAGNEEAASHYRDGAIPGPQNLPLVEAALAWRATGEADDDERAVAALRLELLPLYAEIYGELARRPGVPRASEVAERAAAFAAARA
jgi:hypothetical protein